MDKFLEELMKIPGGFANHDYSGIFFWWQVIAFNVSILALAGIIYSVYKTRKIFIAVHAFEKAETSGDEKELKAKEAWDSIWKQGSSEDENQRKFAVIAADSLIEKILGLAGYEGENLGERLKKIEKGDLDSLDSLWEAHKIRNSIAHESEYKLSKEDSQQALANFEKALRELEYI